MASFSCLPLATSGRDLAIFYALPRLQTQTAPREEVGDKERLARFELSSQPAGAQFIGVACWPGKERVEKVNLAANLAPNWAANLASLRHHDER